MRFVYSARHSSTEAARLGAESGSSRWQRSARISSVSPRRRAALRTLFSLSSIALQWHFIVITCPRLVKHAASISAIITNNCSNNSSSVSAVRVKIVLLILYIELAAITFAGQLRGFFIRQSRASLLNSTTVFSALSRSCCSISSAFLPLRDVS